MTNVIPIRPDVFGPQLAALPGTTAAARAYLAGPSSARLALDVADLTGARDALVRRADAYAEIAELPETADDDRQGYRDHSGSLLATAGELTTLLGEMGADA